MYCNYCGAPNPDGSRFCSTCGKQIAPAAQPAPMVQPAPELQPAQRGPEIPEKKEPSRYSTKAFVALLAGIVLVVAFGLYISVRNPGVSTGSGGAGNAELAAAASEIEEIVHDSFGVNYSKSVKDNTVTFRVWEAGLSDGALLAMDGNTAALSAWDDLASNTVRTQKTLQAALDQKVSKGKVILCVANDTDHERVLLVASSGKVVYDAVNGIDELGIG